VGLAQTKWGKIIAVRGSARFAEQRLSAQRSISGDSLFGYFCGDKSDWPSRGQERVYAMHFTPYSTFSFTNT